MSLLCKHKTTYSEKLGIKRLFLRRLNFKNEAIKKSYFPILTESVSQENSVSYNIYNYLKKTIYLQIQMEFFQFII